MNLVTLIITIASRILHCPFSELQTKGKRWLIQNLTGLNIMPVQLLVKLVSSSKLPCCVCHKTYTVVSLLV